MPSLTLSYQDARAITRGALSRSYADREERSALARLIEQFTTMDRRPEWCTLSTVERCSDCRAELGACPDGRR